MQNKMHLNFALVKKKYYFKKTGRQTRDRLQMMSRLEGEGETATRGRKGLRSGGIAHFD